MLRSMYSGISGMKNFQTKLDVIGNNIANVNTLGFKKGRVTFQDMLSQTTQGPQGAIAGVRGGVNAKQVGTGSKLGSIDTVHTQGFQQNTGGPRDLMIDGDGMFAVDMGNDQVGYTRAGNFTIDEEGTFVTAEGYKVLGVDGQPLPAIPANATSVSIASNGQITYNIPGETDAVEGGQIGIQLFSNVEGLVKAGGNIYLDSTNAGKAGTLVAPDSEDAKAKLVPGALEMSNVDLSEEFTEMITAQRAFQANTRIITTSDEILQELVNLKR